MRNRFVIALAIAALVLVPCGKIASAHASIAAAALAAAGAAPGDSGQPAGTGRYSTAADFQDDRKPACHKTCKTWQGVFTRKDDAAPPKSAPEALRAPYLVTLVHATPSLRSGSVGARSPPEPAGTAFARAYAATSRFHS